MTPGARCSAAIDLLAAVDGGGAPADAIVSTYFKGRRYAGAKDRRAVSDLVYDVLRARARLDWWIARAAVGLAPAPRTRVIAHAALAGAGDLERRFDGGPYRPEPLGENERALVSALAGHRLDHPDMPDWVRLEFPEWMTESLRRRFGGRLAAEMRALNGPAPVDVRVNTLMADRRRAVHDLAVRGIACGETPLSPVGLRLDRRARLGEVGAYRDGLVEVQDEGSQLAALLVGARQTMEVLDLCAGAGGKALAMAATMGGNGSIVACDVSAERLRAMKTRLRRGGVRNVEPRLIAAASDPWLGTRTGAFDRVLVDAPCTGTGTWRRAPEARWRVFPDTLAGLVVTQRRLLAQSADLVRPGGRLVYVTCSVLADENEGVVGGFLDAHPAFRALPVAAVWAETVGGPCPTQGPFLNLSPAATGTDGFFVAVLGRGGGAGGH